MDDTKKAGFVRAMGKRQKFAKGGAVRKHFATGGPAAGLSVTNPAASAPTSIPTGGTNTTPVGIGGAGNGTAGQLLNPGPDVVNAGVSGINQAATPLLNATTGLIAPIGGAAQNVAASFTAQNGFQATQAPLQQGTNAGQLTSAYNAANNGLTAQQQLAAQTAAANGIGNQSQVFNQEQQIASGAVNPAQAQLAQNTATNVANQAALMAGQRGAGANAGLIARQAAQQGAATQQQAVGQEASQQATNQLNAINAAGNIANTQAGQQLTATTGLNTAAQNEQNILQAANSNLNAQQVASQSNANNVNEAVAAQNAQATNSTLGGLLGGASSLLSMLAKGGVVHEGRPVTGVTMHGKGMTLHYADGGSVDADASGSYTSVPSVPAPDIGNVAPPPTPSQSSSSSKGGGSSGGTGAGLMSMAALAMYKGGTPMEGPHKSHVANFLMAKGGKVPAMVSPGEISLSPEQVHAVVHEGANPFKVGERIGGKAKVKGDSLKNDTVPKTLEEGGVIIPRHIATKMDPEKAELFVHRALARKKAGK